jgi:signal transduction histidine kinase
MSVHSKLRIYGVAVLRRDVPNPLYRKGVLPRASLSWVLLVVLCFQFCPLKMDAELPTRKNVLIVSEVGMSHPGPALIDETLRQAFGNPSHYQVEFFSESLDTMSFLSQPEQAEIQENLVHKYRNLTIDAIVAIGPSTIRFLVQSPAKFAAVPVIICCSTIEQAESPVLDSRFTGAWFAYDPQETLDAALSLFPETEHIFVIGGSTVYDRKLIEITKTKLAMRNVPQISYLVDLQMAALLEKVAHLPAHSIVLYTSFWRDAAGAQFTNATVALPLIAKASSAPVFGVTDTYIGHGVLGGCVVNFSRQTTIVADDVRQILSGRPAADIPIVDVPCSPMYDGRQLKHWKVSEANLPAGSEIVFGEPTIWQKHNRTITTVCLVIVILSILIGYSLSEQKQAESAKNRLMKLSGLLIESQEKERSRLASELHDDFSQRLALLSIGLETAERLIPSNPEQACDELRALGDSVGELGNDLHTVSHRLHSSTLQRLGLVAGLHAHCREFSAQFSIEVNFTHNQIPRHVPPDVSVCLFRIVQEALRNVHKHSGADHAEVELRACPGRLLLSIRDRGVGFETTSVKGQGLGLLSMAERCRLHGGEFTIKSEPQRGTTIDVSIPVSVRTDEPTYDATAAKEPQRAERT